MCSAANSSTALLKLPRRPRIPGEIWSGQNHPSSLPLPPIPSRICLSSTPPGCTEEISRQSGNYCSRRRVWLKTSSRARRSPTWKHWRKTSRLIKFHLPPIQFGKRPLLVCSPFLFFSFLFFFSFLPDSQLLLLLLFFYLNFIILINEKQKERRLFVHSMASRSTGVTSRRLKEHWSSQTRVSFPWRRARPKPASP